MKKLIGVLAAPVLLFILACAAPTTDNAGGTQVEGGVMSTPSAPIQVALSQSPTPAAGPFVAFKDGQYEVGNAAGQVKPGKYKTVVPSDSWNCYWERQKDFDGGLHSIIANDNGSAGQSMIVNIKDSDKGFKTTGCGEWKLS